MTYRRSSNMSYLEDTVILAIRSILMSKIPVYSRYNHDRPRARVRGLLKQASSVWSQSNSNNARWWFLKGECYENTRQVKDRPIAVSYLASHLRLTPQDSRHPLKEFVVWVRRRTTVYPENQGLNTQNYLNTREKRLTSRRSFND